ncbi:unnamed protein product, partial [Rotaria sp. Silwood2]
ASSIQSNDLSQTLFSRQQSTISSSPLNRISTNDRPSSFCCFAGVKSKSVLKFVDINGEYVLFKSVNGWCIRF